MKFLFSLIFLACNFCLIAQLNTVTYDSVLINNIYRSYYFETPRFNDKPQAIIFALHGSGGNGLDMQKQAEKFKATARQTKAILVYPNGYKKFWNECRKASTAEANKIDIDEIAFFETMIDYFKNTYNIDSNKVYAIGFSGGGHMAYKLAMTIPNKVHGICAVVASLPALDNLDCAPSNKPTPVMIINSTADGVNPYNGGLINAGNVTLGKVRSTMESVSYWSTLNKHTKKPIVRLITEKDSISVIKTSFSQKKNFDVVLYTIVNGKHEFPKLLDAFETAWAFFKKQDKKRKYN